MLLSAEQMSYCAVGTNVCLDLRRRESALDGRVSAGAGVEASWHDVVATVWLHCDEAQQVGCLRGLEGCPLLWDASIQSQFERRR